VLAVVPLCHSYGLEHGLLAPLWAGSTVHLCSGFDLGVVTDQLERHGITLFPSVPSVYDMMCHAGEARRLPALRKAYAAGAPLPQTVADDFQAKFGVPLSQLFGMTEIGSVTFADPADPHYDPRSVGRPFDGVRVKIVEPQTRTELSAGESGEVLMHAPSMFRGYLNEPASGVIDGYFPTGDLGRVDANGNLTITGRLKLLIEVGGQKVNVLEVEDALRQHPMVGDAVVVAMRVSQTVSRLKAVVTPKTPAHAPVAEELRQFLRGRLTGYKVPRLIEVVASLPRSPAGKVLRSVLENA
jgi:acyl-CoA synthetase (AMP-forming)/AMP-acid ligase II